MQMKESPERTLFHPSSRVAWCNSCIRYFAFEVTVVFTPAGGVTGKLSYE
jgi:hypothetical protein